MRSWTQETSRRRLAVLGALLLASAFACAMYAVRVVYADSITYGYLVWNLFLAWIPFLAALWVYDRHRRGRSGWSLAAPAALWLLFLPNAPYLVTDYIHLRSVADAPIWYDAMLVTAFAWTGLLLGFVSLYLVQVVVRDRVSAVAGWATVLAAVVLSSFGIYLGRFLRWNSWDAIANPGGLLTDIGNRLADPLAYEKTMAVTVLFTGFLTVGYLVLYSFLRLALAEER
jgi:uncharacterized membrane protein